MISHYVNTARHYEIVPLYRQDVVPGQTIKEMSVSVKLRSEMMDQLVVAGGLFSVYAFYVPHRLVWDQWVDYLAGASVNIPSTGGTSWPRIFERGSGQYSLGRRAFKLIYNEFFGDEELHSANLSTWYGDVTQDSDNTIRPVKNLMELARKAVSGEKDPDPTFNAPVSGSDAVINLRQLRESLREADQTIRQQMSSDKYVDVLRSYGVRLDWRIQQAPEFLGRASTGLKPRGVPSTSGAGTIGITKSRFEAELALRIGRKFFAEHGTIWVVGASRPLLFQERSPVHVRNSLTPWRGELQDMPVALKGNLFNTVNEGGQELDFPPFAWLTNGDQVIGNGGDYVLKYTPDRLADVVYPSVSYTPVDASEIAGDDQFVVLTDASVSQIMPFKTMV